MSKRVFVTMLTPFVIIPALILVLKKSGLLDMGDRHQRYEDASEFRPLFFLPCFKTRHFGWQWA